MANRDSMRRDSILSFVPMRLVLASASPRRAELLRAAGFTFETLRRRYRRAAPAGRDAGSTTCGGWRRRSRRARWSCWRSRRPLTAERHPEDIVVLGADTAVVVDGEILGKPRDDHDAAAMLRRLSGRPHEVMTGRQPAAGTAETGRVEATAVEFSPLSRRRDRLVCRERGRAGQGRRVRDPGPGVAVHPPNRRVVLERRRACRLRCRARARLARDCIRAPSVGLFCER